MNKITFISTIHRENGKCNAEELNKIIQIINPEIVFLEALEDTYSEYEQHIFSNFGIFHKKLEIAALQKFSYYKDFKYISLLDDGMSEHFNIKYNIVTQNSELQKLIDNYQHLSYKFGFNFINSLESTNLQEEMRELENIILSNCEIQNNAIETINKYEDSMIKNIYKFCQNNNLNSAIFMCGVAHRKSIIDKLVRIKGDQQNPTWEIYGS